MAEGTDRLSVKMKQLEQPPTTRRSPSQKVSRKADDQPFAFSHNVLSRSQLNQMIDKSKLKKLRNEQKKRTVQPFYTTFTAHTDTSEHRTQRSSRNISNTQTARLDEKSRKLAQLLSSGSGLVYQSKPLTDAAKRGSKAKVDTADDSLVARKQLLKANGVLDVNSAMSLLEQEKAFATP